MELDLYNWLLVFLRVGAFLLVLPFFSVVNFPPTLRVALSALRAASTSAARQVKTFCASTSAGTHSSNGKDVKVKPHSS